MRMTGSSASSVTKSFMTSSCKSHFFLSMFGQRSFKRCTCTHRLDDHMIESHGHKPNQFRCEHCPKSFAWRPNLLKHKMVHGEYRRFPCENCDKVFTDPSNLQVNNDLVYDIAWDMCVEYDGMLAEAHSYQSRWR